MAVTLLNITDVGRHSEPVDVRNIYLLLAKNLAVVVEGVHEVDHLDYSLGPTWVGARGRDFQWCLRCGAHG